MATNPYLHAQVGNPNMNPDWNGQVKPNISQGADYSYQMGRSLSNGYSWFDSIFNPQLKQDYDFAQQMAAQDYQNWYNSEEQRFNRMTELGMNPNLAMEAIAGSSGSGAQSGGAAVGASSPESAAGVVGAATEGVNALSQAHEREALLKANKDNVLTETTKLLKDIGMSDLQIKGMEIALKYMDEKEALSVATLASNLDNICMQYDVMQQNIEESKSRIKEINAQIALYRSQGNLADAQKLQADKTVQLLEQQRLELAWYNNIREMYGIDLKSPLEANLLHMGVTRNPNYEKAASIVYNYYFDTEKAKEEATWFKMPSTPTEAVEYTANNIIKGNFWWSKYLKEGVTNGKEFLNKVIADKAAYAEFKDSYDDARSDLYDIYKAKKRRYKEYRFSGASDSYIQQLKYEMEEAKKEYDLFTEEKFSDELVRRLSPK